MMPSSLFIFEPDTEVPLAILSMAWMIGAKAFACCALKNV